MAMAITIPRYTVDDLEQFPDDGNRYELLDGMLLVTPGPALLHQVVVARLQARLSAAVAWPGHAHVTSPGVVMLPPGTQLEPDLLVIPSRFSPTAHWRMVTERWLAVEAYSRASRIYDREYKRDAYFALGLHEVWLVDAHDRSVEVCRGPGPGEIARDVIRWHVPTLDLVVAIDLAEIFAGIA